MAFSVNREMNFHGYFWSLTLWDRLTVGMEGPPQPKPWFLPGHGYFGNGTMSLFAYLVAPWHCLSSGGCSFVSQHTCKFVNFL